jgi:uncharacterized membrane protein YfcA
MYFQTAGIEVHPLIPPAVAFTISFFTSMGGVSGAFLLLPFQVSMLGFTSPSVSATNHVFNIVAIPGGLFRYIREGRMVWPLAWMVVAGTLPGVLAGAVIRVELLPDPASFKFFAGLVLLYIGLRLAKDLSRSGTDKDRQRQTEAEEGFKRLMEERRRSGQEQAAPPIRTKSFSIHRISYEFHGQDFSVSAPAIFALSLAVGLIGGVYGIGGGAIIAPFFVSFFRLPVYSVAAAALMGTFVTSLAAVIFYQLMAPFYPEMAVAPDWTLGLLFGIGGTAGTYLGARAQKFMPAKAIKMILCACVLFTAIKYVGGFIFTRLLGR